MIFLCDIDDTITNFGHVWIDKINEVHGTSFKFTDVVSWDFMKSLEGVGFDVFKLLDDPKLWQSTTVYPNAIKTLEALVESGHQVYLVTASDVCSPALHTKISHTLRPFQSKYINKSKVIITDNKCLINGDILIDDKLETVEAWIESGRNAYVPTQPWNRKSDPNCNCIEVNLNKNAEYNSNESWIRLYDHFVERGFITNID